jgi:hypothetical protein
LAQRWPSPLSPPLLLGSVRRCSSSLPAQAAHNPPPFPSRARSPPLFRPSATHPRGRPAAVADGRAPPVIPDLESEADWGRDPTRAGPPRARMWPRARTPMRSPPGLFKGRPHRLRPLNSSPCCRHRQTLGSPRRRRPLLRRRVEPRRRRLPDSLVPLRSITTR